MCAALGMCAMLLLAPGWAVGEGQEEDAPRVLLLSKSSGFEHAVIARRGGEASHVEKVLGELAAAGGFELEATKDASLINAGNLARVDAVVFYTTGELTREVRPGEAPMSDEGVDDLIGWVEAGGAFLGFHSAADTFHGPSGDPTPYLGLLGGEFVTHGRQFEGVLRVVDREHPTMEHVPQGWKILDEWYVFRNLAEDRLHVLALLETAGERRRQPVYDRGDYPVIWCMERGKGRVFYNAMGHRADVWDHPVFRQAFLDALDWALGRTPVAAEPNFDKVVP